MKVSTNAFVYVTDRDGWRVQIFTIAGKMRQPGLHCTVGGEIREIAFSALRHKAVLVVLGITNFRVASVLESRSLLGR